MEPVMLKNHSYLPIMGLLLFALPLTSSAKFFIYKYRTGYPAQQVIERADETDSTILFVDLNENNKLDPKESILLISRENYIKTLKRFPPKSRTLSPQYVAISKNDLELADSNQDNILSNADSAAISTLQMASISDNNRTKVDPQHQGEITAIVLTTKQVIMDTGVLIQLQSHELPVLE